MEKKIAEKKEAIGKLIEYRWLYMQQLEKCDSELSSLSEKKRMEELKMEEISVNPIMHR